MNAEDKQCELCKDPDESKQSESIKRYLTYECKHKDPYLLTDCHFWTRLVKGQPKCKRRSDFNDIINNIKSTITNDDILIYLGDLVDGEFTDEEELKTLLLALPGTKILVRGNNDLFSYQFYRSCGFKYVTRKFEWRGMTFSHYPIQHDTELNIHGHIHGYSTYWCPYNKMIDVAYVGGRTKPIKLKDVIDAYPKYSKQIKVDEKHFGESFNTFENVLLNIQFQDDPFI